MGYKTINPITKLNSFYFVSFATSNKTTILNYNNEIHQRDTTTKYNNEIQQRNTTTNYNNEMQQRITTTN